MITKSRLTGKHVLSIFESFVVDRKLKKHRSVSDGKSQSNINAPNFGWVNSFDNDSVTEISSKSPFKKTRSRIRTWIGKRLGFIRPEAKKEQLWGDVDPIQIFLQVRKSCTEVQDYTKRLQVFDVKLEKAKENGQTALAEKLEKARAVVNYESMLRAAGFLTVLTEEKVIEFALKCKKGLELTWIANFVRPIPDSVAERKRQADDLCVFDNYVVLHYDPSQKAFALTVAEEEAKKDPILFGVIRDVRKLYFIGDWKDAECDLTMDEISSVMGWSGPDTIAEDPTSESGDEEMMQKGV